LIFLLFPAERKEMAETRKSGEMVHQKGGFAVREREIRDNVD